MPGKSNNLGQFWQELKRRRVIHVITVYASAAFVIIELVTNLTEPLNLPAKLSTIIIVVLAVGFPLAIILSWLYDLTSEGVEKTKSLSEIREGEKLVISSAWKIATYVSFVVIIGLVTLNLVGGDKQLRPGDIKSLVILPFANFTGDDQLEWFVDGMHAKLIGDMQRVSGIEVLNRTSSKVYKNADKRVQEIATELDVDAVMEVDVLCHGDSICSQVRVIQAFPEEKTLWSAEYKETKSQIPNLLYRITKQIADEVKIELTADEDLIFAKSQTVDTVALDAYLKGLLALDEIDRESLEKAFAYFNIATEIEPDWAPPYAGLTEVVVYQMQMSFISSSIAIPKIYKHLNKLLELDPNSAIAHYAKAITAFNTEWDWEKGIEEFKKSLELNPSNALCRVFYSHLLNILHRPDEALRQANLALKLDPQRPFILALYSALMRQMGDDQIAIDYAKKALSINPNHRFAKGSLSKAYFNVGDYDEWYKIYRTRIFWTDDKYLVLLDSIYQVQGYLAVIEERIKVNEEVKESGGHISLVGQGRRYCKLQEYDKALDYFELAYKNKDPNLEYMTTWVHQLEQLKDNPRYIELLKKMNLPLPEE